MRQPPAGSGSRWRGSRPRRCRRPATHADGVNLRRRSERADRDRNVITTSRAVDDVGEQKSPPLILGEPALELPAHQRVQLAVLVDRPVDAHRRPAASRLASVPESPPGRGGLRCRAAKLPAWSHLRQNESGERSTTITGKCGCVLPTRCDPRDEWFRSCSGCGIRCPRAPKR